MGRVKTLERADQDLQNANPFGHASILIHKKENGGEGTKMDSMIPRSIEPNFVEPMERRNSEYLKKLKEEEIAKRNLTLKETFGVNKVGQVIGVSPNSPQAQAVKFF